MTTATELPNNSNSSTWLFFIKLTFGISIASIAAFIFFMEGSLLVKGYMALNTLFIISATIMMSKTMRDEHENQKLLNKISEAKTNKILQEYTD